jgi:hypothetical protein
MACVRKQKPSRKLPSPEALPKMWSVIFMGAAGLLVGGGISFHQQKRPAWVSISFYVLAGLALLAAYLFTLPAK